MNGERLRTGTRLAHEPLSFTFDGRRYAGQVGDSAASALLAHRVRHLGRSVKYRRLRGLLTAGPEEPNALLSVGAPPDVIPNVAAPQLLLRDGLVLRSQNRWPSLKFDFASALQAGGGLLGAGFYYKTFIWPSWRIYEGIIRRLAGLGEAPGRCQLPPVAIEHCSCDVLVAGAGAAGLAAALAAARAGARVILCEREPLCGGELEFEAARINDLSARDWVDTTLAELATLGVRVLTNTAVVAESSGELIAHAEPGGLPGHNTVYRIRPRQFIVAMGAVERPMVFCDNDRPGVMMLGAAERYLVRYGVQVGARLVLFANHERVYATARRLRAAGMEVRAIVDTRRVHELSTDEAQVHSREALRSDGVECLTGHAVTAALGRHGVSCGTHRIARRISARPADSLRHDPGQRRMDSGGTRRPATGRRGALSRPDWRVRCRRSTAGSRSCGQCARAPGIGRRAA